MSMIKIPIYLEIIKGALKELSDIEYQRRLWIKGNDTEMSSLDEAAAALFDDSCLDIAFEKDVIVFSPEIDGQLKELRKLLQSSLSAQQKRGTAAVLNSDDWKNVCNQAGSILGSIVRLNPCFFKSHASVRVLSD